MKLPYKLLLGALVIVLLSAMLINATVYANTKGFGQYHGITWTYGNQIVKNHNDTYWVAQIWTWVDYPVINMSDIGFSWWTVRETCWGQITTNNQMSGHVRHNASNYWSSSMMQKKSCSGTGRSGASYANHHFYKWPHTHWYNYHWHGAQIP